MFGTNWNRTATSPWHHLDVLAEAEESSLISACHFCFFLNAFWHLGYSFQTKNKRSNKSHLTWVWQCCRVLMGFPEPEHHWTCLQKHHLRREFCFPQMSPRFALLIISRWIEMQIYLKRWCWEQFGSVWHLYYCLILSNKCSDSRTMKG